MERAPQAPLPSTQAMAADSGDPTSDSFAAQCASARVVGSTSSEAAQSSHVYGAAPAAVSDERGAGAGTMEARMARLERSVAHQMEQAAELMRNIVVLKADGPARDAQRSERDMYAA